MSNWIDYNLDVLAGNPAEINQIAERLNQPSLELANWIAQRDGQPLSAVREGLKEPGHRKVQREQVSAHRLEGVGPRCAEIEGRGNGQHFDFKLEQF
jgi:hypothetical protein